MSDLHAALGHIATHACAAAAPVAVDRLLRRTHRRRAARAVAASGLAAVAVLGVALTATAFGDGRTVPPAQTTTPAPDDTAQPSPTQAPTPAEDEPWPPAARLTAEPTCGAPLPAVEDPDPEGSRDVNLFTYVTAWPAVAGEPVELTTSVAIGLDGVELHGRPLAVPQLLVLRDGAVVAQVDLGTQVPPTLSARVPDGGGPATETAVVLEACDGSGPLPAGDYAMLAWQPFAPVPGAEVGRDDVGTFGGPGDLFLVGEQQGLRIEPAGTRPMPGCGHLFTLDPVDDPGTQITAEVLLGRTDGGGFVADPAGDALWTTTTVSPEGELRPVNGNLVTRTYLVDADGAVAFWDDPDTMVGDGWTWTWQPLDCRTGERLVGTYRAFTQAILWPWPGMPATPVTEVVELPSVTVAPES
ncbi:hypothetical protein [Actinotalea fermentans]|uniref:Uncharacterized protein n=1 Tax=Actinotalea fermentans TaxID=43671 RepID=A0A511YY07_9CELL|nr:hypothetical protein [Actinotalea fermentans]GEN80093.1 hypothetical protein AFE02nite_18270 [Actinotalea fermentans]